MDKSPMRPIKSTQSFLFRPGTETLAMSDRWYWKESDTRSNGEGVNQTRFYIVSDKQRNKKWCRMI